MPDRNPHSFDMRGLKFAAAFLCAIVVLFAGVRFGTTLVAERIIADADAQLAAAEAMIAKERATQKMSADALRMLERFHAVEAELLAPESGTAAADAFALAREKFIVVDLSGRRVYLFEKGRAIDSFEIRALGARGTKFDPPTGLFEVEDKSERAASVFFFDECAIHGPASNDCVRLAPDHAQRVFEFAASGTPVFVSKETASATPVAVLDRALPGVSAKAFIVADVATGEVFAEKNADAQRPIASISKLLAALVAHETIHPDRPVIIAQTDRVQTEGSPGSILPNDIFSAGNLLFPLLTESNNSVAYALARYHGEETFVGWMNKKAGALGMSATHMEEPSGLSPENVSSARDLLTLARYLHDNQSFILNASRETHKSVLAQNGRSYAFANFNTFPESLHFVGGKTGYTDQARQTMVSLFDVPVGSSTTTVAIIVLGTEDRKGDIQALLRWFSSSAVEKTE